MLKLAPQDCAGAAIQGDRTSQQDAHAIVPWPGAPKTKTGGLLLALADGMGGHEGGAEASAIAIEAGTHAFLEPGHSDPVHERLHHAVLAANDAVGRARAGHDETYEGMGCTLVLAAIDGHGVSWASVGDSPLWLVRGRSVIRLNRDHSMAPTLAYMVQQGEMSEADAAADPRRHQLRSALMGGQLALIDSGEPTTPLKPQDRIVLASDGVLGLGEEELALICGQARNPEAICQQLLQSLRAEVTHGLDNSSVIVYAQPKRGWF